MGIGLGFYFAITSLCEWKAPVEDLVNSRCFFRLSCIPEINTICYPCSAACFDLLTVIVYVLSHHASYVHRFSSASYFYMPPKVLFKC
jgi:hypothetical protein